MHKLSARLVLLLLLAVPAAGRSWAAELAAGPMVGATDMHTTTVWLQTRGPAQAVLEYWLQDRPAAGAQRLRVRLEAATDNAAQVRIADLQPGTRYAYRVLLDGKPAGEVQHFTTQARWQWREKVSPPDFTALLGSCNYFNDPERDRDGTPYGADHGIFARMAAKNPDLMLWLGDNSYLRENEYTSPEGMAYRYRKDRAEPALQPLLRTGQHAAIWDDHDFGSDDSNSSFVFKQQSLDLFKRYWANASYGLPEAPGVFGTFSFSDTDFFLLDNRWYRDADRNAAMPDKAMFGERQIRWLKNALLMSGATFKVIAGGSQLLNVAARTEGWTNFPRERQEFLDWLQANRINGVLFVSGDTHFTELSKIDREGTYPLHDLTCSPLTAGPFTKAADRDRPGQVPGTLVAERNFCSLAVQGPRQARVLTLKSFDVQGRELWSRALAQQELQTPRR